MIFVKYLTDLTVKVCFFQTILLTLIKIGQIKFTLEWLWFIFYKIYNPNSVWNGFQKCLWLLIAKYVHLNFQGYTYFWEDKVIFTTTITTRTTTGWCLSKVDKLGTCRARMPPLLSLPSSRFSRRLPSCLYLTDGSSINWRKK